MIFSNDKPSLFHLGQSNPSLGKRNIFLFLLWRLCFAPLTLHLNTHLNNNSYVGDIQTNDNFMKWIIQRGLFAFKNRQHKD